MSSVLEVLQVGPGVPHADLEFDEGFGSEREPCLKDILRIMKVLSTVDTATAVWALRGFDQALQPGEGKSLTCQVAACQVSWELPLDSKASLMRSISANNPALENCWLDEQPAA